MLRLCLYRGRRGRLLSVGIKTYYLSVGVRVCMWNYYLITVWKECVGTFPFRVLLPQWLIKVTTQFEHKKSDCSMAVRTRGHPHACTSIDDVVLLAADLPLLDINICNLHQLCGNLDSVLHWSAQHSLIHNEVYCGNCGILMSLHRFCWWLCLVMLDMQVSEEGHCWLFFWKLSSVLDAAGWLCLLVVAAIKAADACVETRMSQMSMIEWQQHICNICCWYLLDHPMQMGGPGWTVKVDESKFMHCKYHCGHFCEGHWVLGMVERDMNLCMMIAVPDRSAATLLPIIGRHVLPETHILTDGWWAYHQLPGPHDIISHGLLFMDPNDPTLHTNIVEGSWANCKAKFCAMHGISDMLFDSHLQEFLWWHVFQDHIFGNILFWIHHYYSV